MHEILILRANVAAAYRTPTLAELTSNGLHELRYEIGDYLPFIPAHKIGLELRADQEKVWFFRDAFAGLRAEVRFDQDRPAPDEIPTDGYTLFDLNLGAHLTIGN